MKSNKLKNIQVSLQKLILMRNFIIVIGIKYYNINEKNSRILITGSSGLVGN